MIYGRISDTIAKWVGTAFEQHRHGEDLCWDIVFFPTPNGTALRIDIGLPNPVLDQGPIVISWATETPIVLTEDQIDTLVREMIEKGREMVSQALNETVNASSNGHGLYVPGN